MTQTTVREIYPNLYLLQVADTRTQYFEALWEIPEGITYNAYVLKTDEGAILFDGWKKTYEEEFIAALSGVVSPSEIKHIVIHHMEPDHSGTLPKVLELASEEVTVWGHPFTQRLMDSLYGIQPKFQAVKDGNTLAFGGHELVFYHAPWLHWPETIVTHLQAENILLTGDIFGGYGIPSAVFDDEVDVEAYLPLARKYTVTVIGYYKDKIGKNLAKLEKRGVQPSMILPAHGLLWRQAPERIVQAYLDWGEGKPVPGKVAVVYSSMYRYVEAAMEKAIADLKALGYQPVVHRLVDDERASLADILSDVTDAEAIVLGTETYESDVFPYTEFLLHEIDKKAGFEKPLVVIAIFGWAAAAGKKLRQQIEAMPHKLVSIVEAKGRLTPEGEAQIQEAIRALDAAVKAPAEEA